jgi:hypothetical protein
VIINLNGDKYTYNFLRASSFPSPIPILDEEKEEVGSLSLLNPLETHYKEQWRINLMINKMRSLKKQQKD